MQVATGRPPVALEGELAPHLSRWLWLVKWLLAIPHYIVLFFLWLAFFVLSVIAFFAVLFTGRYPRGIFGFNVGVLRWTWRVASTPSVPSGPTSTRRSRSRTCPSTRRGSDRLPGEPAPRPPPHRWWLLGIPQFCIAGIFAGAGWSLGLVGILVLVAGVLLLFKDRYPKEIFDLVLGLTAGCSASSPTGRS